MPSRRPHLKSRHGCKQCKAAHIKCDLGRPSCGRCVKTKRSCEFPCLVNRSSGTPSTPHDNNSPGASVSTPGSTNFQTISYPEAETLSWDDLELLHHYSTTTYSTLAHREDIRQMWQSQIPKMAMKQPFLMHSLFSVASLHIASSHPDNEAWYVDRAIRHHNIALRGYSAELRNIIPDNQVALFVCSTLIVISALSLVVLRPHHRPRRTIEEILGIFLLLQGTPLVLNDAWHWVLESEIAPLFKGRDLADSIVLPDEVADAVKLLEECNQHSSSRDSDKSIYALAIQGLKECFKQLCLTERDNGMVLSWPVSLSREYITLLDLRQPMALVILAYFAVILEDVKESWWAKGWGSQLIREVYHVLDDDWKRLMAWPMANIDSDGSLKQ